MHVTNILIEDIKVGTRRREDFGDIEGLAESISKFGLFHPVIVDGDGNLVAGERRLVACRSLGWTEIPVRPYAELTEDERHEIELEENVRRKDLTPLEASKQLTKQAQVVAPLISTASVEKDSRGRKPTHAAPKKDIAAALGVSTSALVSAEQHVAAIEKYPELSVVGTQKGAIDAAKKLDSMPEPERRSTLNKLVTEGRKAIASVTGKTSKPKVRTPGSKYRDNLSQIQTFISSIKSVGAEELTASWSDAERRAFLEEMWELSGELTSFIAELEETERELQRRAG